MEVTALVEMNSYAGDTLVEKLYRWKGNANGSETALAEMPYGWNCDDGSGSLGRNAVQIE